MDAGTWTPKHLRSSVSKYFGFYNMVTLPTTINGSIIYNSRSHHNLKTHK